MGNKLKFEDKMGATVLDKTKANFRNHGKFESGWLYEMRKAAWESYNDLPMPDRVSHLWRYSDPKHFDVDNPSELLDIMPVLSQNGYADVRLVRTEHSAYGYNTSGRNGVTKSQIELEDDGVIFRNLFSATRDDEKLTSELLGKLVGGNFGKFEALNSALWNTGFFLYVPDNTVIDKPIYLVREPTEKYTFTRLLVVIGNNAQVTIVDDYLNKSNGKGKSVNSVVEIFSGDACNISYVNFQRLSESSKNYTTKRAVIGGNTNFHSVFASLGSGVSKVDTGTILNGRGASSNMIGFMLGGNKQHLDMHTEHNHTKGDTYSNLDFKVVLKDKAQSAYTGLIRIDKDAKNCEAYQENRNLLLNEGAKSESIPELEILNEDVRCSHGATMGPIDPEMVYYLKSRGISKEDAEKMIVSGFLEPTFKALPKGNETMVRELFLEKLETN
ncbi:MAG: Fe-S cluster assembly protein SufD [candidate division Zixibacteria bacterium]|nr:Fe-S cluster assembly protein SufD [candidate division Zixibacteria bacterium]